MYLEKDGTLTRRRVEVLKATLRESPLLLMKELVKKVRGQECFINLNDQALKQCIVGLFHHDNGRTFKSVGKGREKRWCLAENDGPTEIEDKPRVEVISNVIPPKEVDDRVSLEDLCANYRAMPPDLKEEIERILKRTPGSTAEGVTLVLQSLKDFEHITKNEVTAILKANSRFYAKGNGWCVNQMRM